MRPRIAFERGGLAGAVGADEPEDAALFDTQIDAVQRDGRAVGLAEAARFYAGHGFSSPSRVHPSARLGGLRRRVQQLFRPSGRAAEWLRRPWATVRSRNFCRSPCSSRFARAGVDEHAETAAALDELLVDQLLVALENRERIDPILGRDVAHRRQRIAFFQHARRGSWRRPGPEAVGKSAARRSTPVPSSDVVNYNTRAQASSLISYSLK